MAVSAVQSRLMLPLTPPREGLTPPREGKREEELCGIESGRGRGLQPLPTEIIPDPLEAAGKKLSIVYK